MGQDNAPTPVRFSSPGKMILAIIVTAVVAGGGIFIWQTISANKEKNSLRQEIVQMKNDMSKIDADNAKLQSEKKMIETNVEELNKEKEELAKTKLELEMAACTGLWKNDACIEPKCDDSDAVEEKNTPYIQGSVTYVNLEGETQTVTDDCNGSTLLEVKCFEDPTEDDRFNYQMEEVKCRKGCEAGACLK